MKHGSKVNYFGARYWETQSLPFYDEDGKEAHEVTTPGGNHIVSPEKAADIRQAAAKNIEIDSAGRVSLLERIADPELK